MNNTTNPQRKALDSFLNSAPMALSVSLLRARSLLTLFPVAARYALALWLPFFAAPRRFVPRMLLKRKTTSTQPGGRFTLITKTCVRGNKLSGIIVSKSETLGTESLTSAAERRLYAPYYRSPLCRVIYLYSWSDD